MRRVVTTAILLAVLLAPAAAEAATRIEGEYQLLLDLRKQDRAYAWNYDSNNGDTWAASQFRIFSQPRTGVEAFLRIEADWNPWDNFEERPRYFYRESHVRFLKDLKFAELDTYLFHRQDRFWVNSYLLAIVDPGKITDSGNAQGFRFDIRRAWGIDYTFIQSDFSDQSRVGGDVIVPPPSDDAYIMRLRRSFLGNSLRTGLTYNRKVEEQDTETGYNEVLAMDARYTFLGVDYSLEFAKSRTRGTDAPPVDGWHWEDWKIDNFSAALPRDAALKAEVRSWSLGRPSIGYYNIAPQYFYYGPDYRNYLGGEYDGDVGEWATQDVVGWKLNSWYLIPRRAITLTFDYAEWEKSVFEQKRMRRWRAELYTEYVNGFTSKFWYNRKKTTDSSNPLFQDVTKNYDFFAEVQVESRLAWMRVQGKLKDLETEYKKELVSLEASVNISSKLKVYSRYTFGNDPARLRKGLFTELQYRPQQNMELFVSYGPYWIGDSNNPVDDGDLAGGADNKDMFRLILKGNF